jgi:hypothetical protein
VAVWSVMPRCYRGPHNEKQPSLFRTRRNLDCRVLRHGNGLPTSDAAVSTWKRRCYGRRQSGWAGIRLVVQVHLPRPPGAGGERGRCGDVSDPDDRPEDIPERDRDEDVPDTPPTEPPPIPMQEPPAPAPEGPYIVAR